MKRIVVIKRLDYEASAGWTTYGTSLAAFSLFWGVATRHQSSSEKSRSEDRVSKIVSLRISRFSIFEPQSSILHGAILAGRIFGDGYGFCGAR
jgi:hypothetical protein